MLLLLNENDLIDVDLIVLIEPMLTTLPMDLTMNGGLGPRGRNRHVLLIDEVDRTTIRCRSTRKDLLRRCLWSTRAVVDGVDRGSKAFVALGLSHESEERFTGDIERTRMKTSALIVRNSDDTPSDLT